MAATAAIEAGPGSKPGKRRLVVFAAVGGLLLAGAGGTFMLGLTPLSRGGANSDAPASPVFVEMPDIVANLNTSGRRQIFVRVRSRIEVAHQADVALVQSAMPRLLDLFTTYLRETRPEELRGSAGSHRLREELIARANIATRPGVVTDVLFVELIVQ
jgi:flagellar FliL protein